MHYIPIVGKICLAFTFTTGLLYNYGNWFRHRIAVTLVVFLAWFFSLLIIFVLPNDITSTVFRQCIEENIHYNNSDVNSSSPVPATCQEPYGHVADQVFPNLWRTVYWSSQCLTWLIMPMMQSYIKAGDFTIKGKLKSALIDNAIYYGSYLFICGILLIYLAIKGVDLDWQKLKAIASSASNTWGLFLLVLLLGYALVEVPRGLWNRSNSSYVLNHAYFKAAKLSSDKCEAEESVDDVLDSLQAISLAVKPGNHLFVQFETILNKVPVELRERMVRRQLPADTPTDPPSEKALVRLHKQVIKSLQCLQRTETQWNILVYKIFLLEDTLKNINSRDRTFKYSFSYEKKFLRKIPFFGTIDWYWRCVFETYVMKLMAILAGTLSVLVVWCEVTFFNKQPVLSIFALIVNYLKDKYDYTTIDIFSTLVIAFLCYCAFSTVLKIRILNLYYLAPNHQTNEYSLVFSGMMISRLTAPLCLNFLGLIHMDSHIIKKQVLETHYTQIMGHMDVIGIISDGFNIYFPMIVLALCLATYFSLGARLLSMLGFHQFVGDDEMTHDLINEGRDLIKRERRRIVRAEESRSRRRELQERFNTRSSIDTVRMNRGASTESTRANLLQDSSTLETYDGTRIHIDTDVDTSLKDIDSRFGVSTRNVINEQYDSSSELDPSFIDSYQLNSNYRNRVGHPPRGIFDDV